MNDAMNNALEEIKRQELIGQAKDDGLAEGRAEVIDDIPRAVLELAPKYGMNHETALSFGAELSRNLGEKWENYSLWEEMRRLELIGRGRAEGWNEGLTLVSEALSKLLEQRKIPEEDAERINAYIQELNELKGEQL